MNAEDTKPNSFDGHSQPDPNSHSSTEPLEDESRAPKKGFQKFLLPGIILLLLLGGVGWILARNIFLPLYFMSQMKPQLTKVNVATPKSGTIEDSSDYVATLNSRQSVTLQPRVSGQISQIYVRAGERVQAGTSLIQIDAAEQRALVNSRESAVDSAAADVESAEAEVASASDTLRSLEARLASAQADLQLRQREYDRNRELFEGGGAISRQTLDERRNALQSARAQVNEAEANIRAQRAAISRSRAGVSRNQRLLEQARSNVNEVEAQLQYYTITAPFTGVVGNIPVKEGDFVNNSTQLLTFTQNEQLEVEIAVPLERASDLRRGLRVQLLDAQNKVAQTGTISFIAPNVDRQAQSVLVKATFANVKGQLRADQYTRARIIWNTRPGVLVPTSIISRLAGRDFVFVAVPFKNSGCKELAATGGGPPAKEAPNPEQIVAAQRAVQLGKIIGNNQEVLEGVSASDRIVTSGILQLQNCTAIEAQDSVSQVR